MKLFVATALAVLFALPAYALSYGNEEAVADGLTTKYGEAQIEQRTANMPGTEMPVTWSVWVNHETGSWSLTGTRDGVTCLFQAGSTYNGQTIAAFLSDPAT